MILGYARVSSKSQKDNNSFEQQAQEILTKYPSAKIMYEQFTGTTTHRPILSEIVSSLQTNDMLVVTKLDRLARTTVEGIELIRLLFAKKVSVHVLNIGLLEETALGDFFMTVMLAVAALERSQIVERCQSGKAIAKLSPDFREGRPKTYGNKQIAHALELLESHTYKETEQLTGISKSTLARAKRKRKTETAEQLYEEE